MPIVLYSVELILSLSLFFSLEKKRETEKKVIITVIQ
jgi:hypothetical protein